MSAFEMTEAVLGIVHMVVTVQNFVAGSKFRAKVRKQIQKGQADCPQSCDYLLIDLLISTDYQSVTL